MAPARIGIIGGGPRAVATAEQLGIVLPKVTGTGVQQAEVLVIDSHEPGAGRIWRPEQCPELLMNTVVGQVTIFSGPCDAGPHRPGHGPSLYEWLQNHPDPSFAALTPNSYAPRSVYGEYLLDAMRAIQTQFPKPHVLKTLRATVNDVKPQGNQLVLRFDDGRADVLVDVLVLATGHATERLGGKQASWVEFSKSSDRCRFLSGDSAADLDLDQIRPGEATAVLGLGLGFHDILAMLTAGRGGRFEPVGHHQLVYIPSGDEPSIVAGSRGGLPIPARGVNQKMDDWRYTPRFFHDSALAAARRQASANGNSKQLSFAKDIYPLIRAELEHVYFGTWVRWLHGQLMANAFWQDHAAMRDPHARMPAILLRQYGLTDVPEFDLFKLARPFEHSRFNSPEEFNATLRRHVERDRQEALSGNLDSPLKAACDVLRDVRDTLRSAVEFDGLAANSFETDFKQSFAPAASLLSAGPPVLRVTQMLAIHEAGILKFVGPQIAVHCDRDADCFRLASPVVDGSYEPVTTLIDSRVPSPSLLTTENRLLQNMRSRGLVTPFVRTIADGEATYGGIDVAPHSHRAVSLDGSSQQNILAIGLPTESPRWFTQVGSASPGTVSRFTLDAAAVAKGCSNVISRFEHESFPIKEAA